VSSRATPIGSARRSRSAWERVLEERGCQSTSECESGSACKLPEGQCVELGDAQFMGTFSCTVESLSLSPSAFNLSQVTGKFDGFYVPLAASALCSVDGDSFGLGLLGLQNKRLHFSSDLAAVGQYNELQPFVFGLSPIGILRSPGGGQSIPADGYVASGTLEFDRLPALGEELRGYLDVQIVKAEDRDVIGVPCPRGQVDCGAYPFARSSCTAVPNTDYYACFADCASAGDCVRYDGDVCSGNTCYRSCQSNADCTAPLTCEPLGTGRVCY
jgi:hypothetical protein